MSGYSSHSACVQGEDDDDLPEGSAIEMEENEEEQDVDQDYEEPEVGFYIFQPQSMTHVVPFFLKCCCNCSTFPLG